MALQVNPFLYTFEETGKAILAFFFSLSLRLPCIPLQDPEPGAMIHRRQAAMTGATTSLLVTLGPVRERK